jgi:formylglycine-generating enzyme required for sulfatase activity
MDYDIIENPRVYHGLCHLPETRLIEIANKAGVSLKGIKPGFYGQIVEAILNHIESFDDLKTLLTPKDFDIIGQKNSIGNRKTWNRPYLAYDHAVFVDMTRKSYGAAQHPVRESTRNASHADLWTELASLKVWSKLEASQKTKTARSLAKSLGEGFTFVDFVGAHGLMRFQHTALKLHFIAIPGGKYSMGLTDDEKKELTRLAKKHDNEEAKFFARDIAETARPVHEVKLPPFLCAQAPITGAQGKKFTKSAELLGGRHNIYWYGAKVVLNLTTQSDTRLLTEAEWEYVARAGGTRTWLNGEEDPEAYVQRIRSGKLLEDDHPFGVCGLGWGTWVEDGWHVGYKNAPSDGSAWEPREIPNVVRSGALLSHPWQTDGEEFMLHTAYRERLQDKQFPVLLARDLPKRKR